MNMKDRVIERAAELLVDRFLADEFGTPDAKPAVDGDGDLHCPDCPDRVFVTRSAYRQHRTKTHHEPPADRRSRGRGPGRPGAGRSAPIDAGRLTPGAKP